MNDKEAKSTSLLNIIFKLVIIESNLKNQKCYKGFVFLFSFIFYSNKKTLILKINYFGFIKIYVVSISLNRIIFRELIIFSEKRIILDLNYGKLTNTFSTN